MTRVLFLGTPVLTVSVFAGEWSNYYLLEIFKGYEVRARTMCGVVCFKNKSYMLEGEVVWFAQVGTRTMTWIIVDSP